MVEITFKISERDDGVIDVVGRGSMVAPYTPYEQHVGRAIIPMLDCVMIQIQKEFPTKDIRIAVFDSPLNPKLPPPEEPWKFPGRD